MPDYADTLIAQNPILNGTDPNHKLNNDQAQALRSLLHEEYAGAIVGKGPISILTNEQRAKRSAILNGITDPVVLKAVQLANIKAVVVGRKEYEQHSAQAPNTSQTQPNSDAKPNFQALIASRPALANLPPEDQKNIQSLLEKSYKEGLQRKNLQASDVTPQEAATYNKIAGPNPDPKHPTPELKALLSAMSDANQMGLQKSFGIKPTVNKNPKQTSQLHGSAQTEAKNLIAVGATRAPLLPGSPDFTQSATQNPDPIQSIVNSHPFNDPRIDPVYRNILSLHLYALEKGARSGILQPLSQDPQIAKVGEQVISSFRSQPQYYGFLVAAEKAATLIGTQRALHAPAPSPPVVPPLQAAVIHKVPALAMMHS